MLAVIDKGADTATRPTPLLFVHGGYHAAWCWDEHFLEFFVDLGYRVLAPDLRGHGLSPSVASIHSCSIADYVADVRATAERLPRPPAVIGHSMGGFIAQKYLEDNDAAAGVLVASAPVKGVRGSVLRALRSHPLGFLHGMVTRNPLSLVSSPAQAREAFFSAETPEHLVVEYASRLEQESQRALGLDMLVRNLPRPERISAPMLVLGGEFDGTITASEVRETAAAYRTTAEFFAMGHNMMLEPGWRGVAERIRDWLIGVDL
jgi:pimeloyl-ACP methyl ester carboxylesterase